LSVPLYFDHNMPRAVARGLVAREVDVLTAIGDGNDRTEDEHLLAHATTLGRLLVSQDKDFTVITTRWLRLGRTFAGAARVPQEGMSISAIIEQLEMLAKASDPHHVENQVFYLPLW
jgi:hypothetical protein